MSVAARVDGDHFELPAGAVELLRQVLRHGPLPHPSSPLVIHRFRDPRAGDAYVLVLPW